MSCIPEINCDENNLICNIHTVPLTDLLTAGTTAIIGLGIYFGKTREFSLAGIILLVIILLFFDIIIHPYFGVPNNISYYFGLGKKPDIWRS